MKFPIFAVALVGLMAISPGFVGATGQVGEIAPNISLPNTAGETVDIVFGQGEVFLMAFVGYS